MSNDYTLIPESEFMAMCAFIPEDLFYGAKEVTMGTRTYRQMKVSDYQEVKGRYEAYQERNGRLNRCAELNRKGIALEKSGNVKDAIAIYEQNISGDCYPATHSFDRLCIIYRKAKDYKNEVRVLEKACKVFRIDKYKTRLAKAKELLSKSK